MRAVAIGSVTGLILLAGWMVFGTPAAAGDPAEACISRSGAAKASQNPLECVRAQTSGSQDLRKRPRGLKQKPCFKIWWKEGVCRQRPHYLIMGARANMSKIKWSHWGHRKAIGKGRIYNAPSFGQPDSGIGPTRGRIVLSKRVNCFNRGWVFRKYKVRYGPGLSKTFSKVSVFEPCAGLRR